MNKFLNYFLPICAVAIIALPYLCVFLKNSTPNDSILTTLVGLVTILIGWQIISVLTIEKKVEEFRQDSIKDDKRLEKLHFSLVALLSANECKTFAVNKSDVKFYCKMLEYLSLVLEISHELNGKPHTTIDALKKTLDRIEESGEKFNEYDKRDCDNFYHEIIAKKDNLDSVELEDLRNLNQRRNKLCS
ncbi:MAG: hypothetical protein HFJ87_10525 [Muribaculaceae bacterium]|nr:hypothetical protein [Muribaculaceae bacterium]